MQQAASSSAEAGTTAAAEGTQDAAAAAPRASTSGRAEALKSSRTFSWQEKVYSKAELVAAQVRPSQSACHEPCTTTCTLAEHYTDDRLIHCTWSNRLCFVFLPLFFVQAHMQASKQQGRPASSPRRAAHFGSQIHIGTDCMLVSAPLQQHAASGVIRPHFYATQYLNSRTRACHKQHCTAQHLWSGTRCKHRCRLRGMQLHAELLGCVCSFFLLHNSNNLVVAVGVAAAVLSTGAVITPGGLHTFQLRADG